MGELDWDFIVDVTFIVVIAMLLGRVLFWWPSKSCDCEKCQGGKNGR